MTTEIRISANGGPEQLVVAEREMPKPAAGEVLVEQKAIGLNFIDVYFRTGLYPAPQMPFVPGMEGAGVVMDVGEGVTSFKSGDRIAYAGPIGAYASHRTIAADKIVKLPDAISFETAAGMMLKGMTAQYLLRQTFRVEAGQTILFHAAGGGVGLIAGQWAKKLGVTAIGTAGSTEKCALASANGYQHMIDYSKEDFVGRVAEITAGKKCDVVYDSVGRDTFPGSLDCLKSRGMWVSFGQSSGALDPIDFSVFAQKGSLYASRPSLFHYIATPGALAETAGELFDVVASGDVKIPVNAAYPLKDVAQAHRDLEARKTSGSTILIP